MNKARRLHTHTTSLRSAAADMTLNRALGAGATRNTRSNSPPRCSVPFQKTWCVKGLVHAPWPMQSLLSSYGKSGGSGDANEKKRETATATLEEAGTKKAKITPTPPAAPLRDAVALPPLDSSDDDEDAEAADRSSRKQQKTAPASKETVTMVKKSTLLVPPQVRSGRPNRVVEDFNK